MANDSVEIIDGFEFHPTDTPRGCLYYDPSILTADQQYKLNDFKNNIIRKNHKYLKKNPEIRAFIALIYRHVFRRRPRKDVHLTIWEFFHRPRRDIARDISEYIEANNLQYHEEVEEEEVPEDQEIQYYLMKSAEDEAEEETSEEKQQHEKLVELPILAKLSYIDAFRGKTNDERDYITEIFLQQITQLPCDEMEDYKHLELHEFDSKTDTTVSTANFEDRKGHHHQSRVNFNTDDAKNEPEIEG